MRRCERLRVAGEEFLTRTTGHGDTYRSFLYSLWLISRSNIKHLDARYVCSTSGLTENNC